MIEGEEMIYGAGSQFDPNADLIETRLTIAVAWTAARHARDQAFGSTLFFNPARDILLALYIGHVRGHPDYVKTVTASSAAPTTTVSRWIILLEKERLLGREIDPKYKRRTLLRLLPEGVTKMEQALDKSALSDARLGLGRLRLVK